MYENGFSPMKILRNPETAQRDRYRFDRCVLFSLMRTDRHKPSCVAFVRWTRVYTVKEGRSRMRNYWSGELLGNFGQNANHKVGRKRISCTLHLHHHWMQQGYLYQTKAKSKCFGFFSEERISCRSGVWGEKQSWFFISIHFMITILAPVHQSRQISHARRTSLHGPLVKCSTCRER